MDAPVIVESNINPLFDEINNKSYGDCSGFPFDESDFNQRDRDRSFRSHIDDIVKRHPELAEHLSFENKFDNFPFTTTNSWGHKRRGSSDRDSASSSKEPTENRRFNRPFGSRLDERFGFPFTSSFDGEPEYYSRPKKQDRSQPEEKTSTPQEAPVQTEEKPPQPPNIRSRKPNSNIQQSNTVDLGQKQDPVVDSRSQRSMSAPPENRAGQQRYVSSINIPMFGQGDTQSQQQTTQNSTQQQPQQQQNAQGKSNERVIPIHVEGRDTPVVPKNEQATSTQQQPQPQRNFQRPSPFGHWNRNDTPYYTGDTFYTGDNDTQRPKREDIFTSHGPFKTQQQTPPPPPQQPQQQQQQKQQQPPQQRKEPSPQPQQPTVVPPPPASQKVGPLDQIQCIQKDVLALMTKVELFNGKPKDKEYIYLDEMLTRNLLKLDDVETEGKDDIRQARKEAINCIQRCISILEAKAAANEQLRKQLMNVDATGENPNGNSLEVSGVARSGTEVESTADSNMDVDSTANVEETQKNKTEVEMELDAQPTQTTAVTNETVSKDVPQKESA